MLLGAIAAGCLLAFGLSWLFTRASPRRAAQLRAILGIADEAPD